MKLNTKPLKFIKVLIKYNIILFVQMSPRAWRTTSTIFSSQDLVLTSPSSVKVNIFQTTFALNDICVKDFCIERHLYWKIFVLKDIVVLRELVANEIKYLSNKSSDQKATVGMFDWSLFDNSNRTTYVRRPSKVGMFDSDYVRHGAAIVEQNINRT